MTQVRAFQLFLSSAALSLCLVLRGGDAPVAATSGYAVVEGGARVEVEWNGVLMPTRAQGVQIAPKVWPNWILESAAEHGQAVKAGDLLLTMRSDELTDVIEKLERELAVAREAVEKVRITIAFEAEEAPLELDARSRAAEIAAEQLAEYGDYRKSMERKGAALGVKAARQKLAYEEEELKQLEKMYKQDDLADETEQIVLQRQRNGIEHLTFAAERAEADNQHYDRDETRRAESVTLNKAAKDRELRKARALAGFAANQRQRSLEDQQRQVRDLEKRLADHQSDRALLQVRATLDGVVYRGDFAERAFKPGPDKLYQAGSKVPPLQTLLTVVAPESLRASGLVPENQVGYLKPGLTVAAEPALSPGPGVLATIAEVSAIPDLPGQFAVEVTIPPGDSGKFVAGGAIRLTAIPVDHPSALMIPSKFLFRDPKKPTGWCVQVAADGKSVVRPIVPGVRVGDRIEVIEGLAAGERIIPAPGGDGK